ncbi:MAG: hypothetical protein D6752_07295 [Candidatus Nitrosothermus koennekii]|nr:MAG: hypothetical protein D6752_07295 [Candidatus Nitrosothermus koennekii]
MKYKILAIIFLIMVITLPISIYAENKTVIIGKGDWESDEEKGKVGFFIIKEDGEIKRAFFKFLDKGNWLAINLDKWTENGGMVMNNAGDMAMIVLEDGKGEFHAHGEGHNEEYRFDYTVTEITL